MFKFKLSSINIVPVPPRSGLVAFATCLFNESFFIGNIAIHSSPSSDLGFRCVFPNKRLTSGKIVDVFCPVSADAQELFERQIVAEYVRVMDNFHFVDAC